MKIEDYLKTLTSEELEEHKDLIEECREREKMIEKARIESIRGLMRLQDNLMGEVAEEVLSMIWVKAGRA